VSEFDRLFLKKKHAYLHKAKTENKIARIYRFLSIMSETEKAITKGNARNILGPRLYQELIYILLINDVIVCSERRRRKLNVKEYSITEKGLKLLVVMEKLIALCPAIKQDQHWQQQQQREEELKQL